MNILFVYCWEERGCNKRGCFGWEDKWGCPKIGGGVKGVKGVIKFEVPTITLSLLLIPSTYMTN